MIRIGICDDESRAREALKIQLEQLLREEDAKVIYDFLPARACAPGCPSMPANWTCCFWMWRWAG